MSDDLLRLLNEETVSYEMNPEWEVVTNRRVTDALRAVLEQGEKLEWCETHRSAVTEFDDQCDWAVAYEGGFGCDLTTQFRFPAALLEGDPE